MDNKQQQAKARINRLSRRGKNSKVNIKYTKFVRTMRLALPIAAMVVVAILFLRSGVEDKLTIDAPQIDNQLDNNGIKERKISQNELINPKFETMDKKNQPYKITADRALQGEKNKDLIMLEKPVGEMTMKDGERVTMQSKTGAYLQDSERFFLQGDVIVKHGDGYTIYSQEAHIDLNKNLAWSEKNIRGIGPEITINATGVKANGNTGEIIFKGPAELVLENGLGGI